MPKTKKEYYDSDSEEEAPKQKKQKKKKDPNAPKRPTSAYFFFAGDVRPAIREENPGWLKPIQCQGRVNSFSLKMTKWPKKNMGIVFSFNLGSEITWQAA